MSLAATLPAAILDTILIHLAALFLPGTAGDPIAARAAAAQMLGAYNPQTENELRLAANIVGFSFHALEALGQAAAPDMPLTRVLRLRGGAVSLNREATKAERRLTELQRAREQHPHAEPAEIQPIELQPSPKIEKAVALIQQTGKVSAAAKASGVTWSRAYEERQTDLRIAASLKRAEAKIAAMNQADATIAAMNQAEATTSVV